MSGRCGCAEQCPPCPQNVFVQVCETSEDVAIESIDFLTIDFTVPGGLPRYGITVVAEVQLTEDTPAAAGTIHLVHAPPVGAEEVIRAVSYTGPDLNSYALVSGLTNLAPGAHQLILRVNGTGGITTILSAAMRLDLIRSTTLTISECVEQG